MKIFMYNISLSFNKIKHSIYGYIVISVVLTLNLIIPAISVSHTSYISESKSIFPYSHGYYYYNWSGELFSQGELAKISKLYGDNTFIVSENIIDIDKQMIKVFASNKDVLDYIISVGCGYYFNYIPLSALGLPVEEECIDEV